MINPFGRKNLKLSDTSLAQLDADLRLTYSTNYVSLNFSSVTEVENTIYLAMDSFSYDDVKKLLDKVCFSLKEYGVRDTTICIVFRDSNVDTPKLQESSLTISYSKGVVNLLNLDLYDVIRHRFPKAHWLSISYNSIAIDIDDISEAPRAAAEAVRVVLNDFIEDFPSSINVRISIFGYISAEYEFGSTDKNRLDSTVVNSVKFMKILSFLLESHEPEIKKIALTFKEKERGMIAHVQVFTVDSYNLDSYSLKVKATIEQLFPELSITFY